MSANTNNVDKGTSHEWLSTDKELETGESLMDEDILTIMSKLPAYKNGDRNNMQSDDEDTDKPPWKISAKDAKFAISMLILYLKQHLDLPNATEHLDSTWALYNTLVLFNQQMAVQHTLRLLPTLKNGP